MTATVALTGGTGFVGGAILRALASNGYRLRLLARRRSPAGEIPPGAEIVHGSLEDRDSLADLLKGADAAVHAAGAIKAIAAEEFRRVNRDGAAALAEAAAQAGVGRFVLISSLAARAPELSTYAASKHAGEVAVLERLKRRVTVLRPPIVYGPGDRETLPLFRAAAHGVLPIPGPRQARLSFLQVDDCADAVVAALAASRQPEGTYEIDDGAMGGYGWQDIAAALGAALGRTVRPIFVPAALLTLLAGAAALAARASGRPMMLRPDKLGELRHSDWVCAGPRLAEESGWRPRHALADGFRDAIAWYRAQGWMT